MNPEQEKPTEENTDKPEDGAHKPPADGQSFVSKKSVMPKWLLWLLLLLLILALLFGGWWFFMKDDKKTSNMASNSSSEAAEESAEETPVAVCDEGLTNYENSTLGFAFCYPTEWGTVAVADAQLDPSDTGNRWNLSFSDKEEVNIGVASADWETSFGRDGVCSDPASPSMPAFAPFSTAWEVYDEGGGIGTTVSRGIEMMADEYLIQEFATDMLAEVVCVTGYSVLDGTPYGHTAASYSTSFTAGVPTPAAHMAAPNTLVSVADRDAFYAFVKSVRDI